MRKIFSLFLILFTTTCLGSDIYPVIWTKELGITLNNLKEIPQILSSKKISTVNYVNNKNQQAVATNCSDYFKLTKAGFYPVNNVEIAEESWFKSICPTLVYLFHAKPAKNSAVRNFDLQKDYGLLPAAIIFPNIGEGAQAKGDVQQAFPDSKIQGDKPEPNVKPDKTAILLKSKKAGLQADISILAWGDFTGDGHDEMLIFVANYIYDLAGTYRHFSTYLLTRKSEKDPLILINP